MSNLTRPTVDVLLNTLSNADFGVYFDGSAKHVVLKKLGFDFVGANSTAVVKRYKAGQKMVRTLVPNWKWNGEATQLFEIEVTRQPLYDSTPENQHPISHSYQFIMSGFATETMGTLVAADKNAIFDGLIAAITADTQLNENAVLTGACVVATKTAAVDTEGSEVVGAIVLTAKNNGDIFTVRTYEEQFTQSVNPTTPQIKDKMPTVDIQRIFAIKDENVGQAFQNVSVTSPGASTVTPFNNTGVVSPQNIIMHKNAFCLAVADLELPEGVHFAGRASDKELGLSMRVVRQYTINNDSIPTRLDVLYGWAPLYPELACRVAA